MKLNQGVKSFRLFTIETGKKTQIIIAINPVFINSYNYFSSSNQEITNPKPRHCFYERVKYSASSMIDTRELKATKSAMFYIYLFTFSPIDRSCRHSRVSCSPIVRQLGLLIATEVSLKEPYLTQRHPKLCDSKLFLMI